MNHKYLVIKDKTNRKSRKNAREQREIKNLNKLEKMSQLLFKTKEINFADGLGWRGEKKRLNANSYPLIKKQDWNMLARIVASAFLEKEKNNSFLRDLLLFTLLIN